MNDEYDELLSSYYGDDMVRSMIAIKVETQRADEIAAQISDFPQIIDLYLVTGETDMLVKAAFKDYPAFRDFVMNKLPTIDGIKETKTFMVVTVYKEGGQKSVIKPE